MEYKAMQKERKTDIRSGLRKSPHERVWESPYNFGSKSEVGTESTWKAAIEYLQELFIHRPELSTSEI